MPLKSAADARKAGYTIRRGSYIGTPDDRLDRWYIERIDAPCVDRRGSGFRTRREALEDLAQYLESADD